MPSNIIFVEIKWSVISARPPPQAKTVSTAAFKHLAGWLATILAIEGFGDAGREMHLRTRRTAS